MGYLGLSGCDGVTAGAVADTVVAPYNRVPDLDETVAAVVVEPVAANMGLVAPVPGFLEGLRAACDAAGALLVFDEVITGFRLACGGATDHFGVTPDMWCFGKVVGGGLPVGAFGGRHDVMEVVAPLGGVYQAGTLSGNPIAMQAGLSTLDLVDSDEFYASLDTKTAALVDGLQRLADNAEIPFSTNRVGSMFGFFFTSAAPVTAFSQVMNADGEMFNRFFHAMLDGGVNLAPSPFESGFVSAAHGDLEIEATLNAAEAAFKSIRS